MNKAEYLKRYLSSNEVKKKKKVKRTKLSCIVDDDIDINKLTTAINDEDDDEKPIEVTEFLEKEKATTFANNWIACDETNDIKIEATDDYNNIVSGFNFEKFKVKQEPLSPQHDTNLSPETTANIRRRHDSDDEDASPPRRNERHDSDTSPPRKTKGDKSVSPPRRSKRYDSDTSPPRKPSDVSLPPRRPKKQDLSPPRKKRRDSDLSPPRRSGNYDSKTSIRREVDSSPPRRSKRNDSDLSPLRKSRDEHPVKHSNGTNRHNRNRSTSVDNKKRKRHDSSSDISPPRKSQGSSKFKTELLSPRSSKVKSEPTSPRPDTSRASRPKMDSLENKRTRHDSDVDSSEDEAPKVDEEPKVIIRDKLGRRVDENLKKLEEEKKKAYQEKYNLWGRGLKQGEMMKEMAKDYETEANKPMARYADDDDLNASLKDKMLKDDPMYEYMQRKKAKEAGSSGKARPKYTGPQPPPNRFNIEPGYRWDGVNRSNGFEIKLVLLANERRAKEQEHYKWATEDM